jgi:hypothetical protein
VLGFGLLGDDRSITAWHYLLALAALIPVGAEHGMVNSQADQRAAGRMGVLVNAATLILVLAAYAIGSSNS